MTAGVLVAVVALVCATAFGLWWRSRDGRLRVVASKGGAARSGADTPPPSASAPASRSASASASPPASDSVSGLASTGGSLSASVPGSLSGPDSVSGLASTGGSLSASAPESLSGLASTSGPGSAAASPAPSDSASRPAAVEAGEIAPELLEALGVDRAAEATLLQFSSAFCQPCRAVRRISSEVAAIVPGVRHVEVDAESHLDVVRELRIWRTPTLLILDRDGREVRRATGVPSKPQLIAALGQVLTN
ncbi:thioredoxin family protein [Actinoplanes sp. NPDC049265]|uniref:thioredoxin family protein n=1 Tax=Actinoplanes sp. NPDC049265 TaxID=3363902 RepID=UPI00371EC4D3